MASSISPSTPGISPSASQALISSGVTSPKWYIYQSLSGDSLSGVSGSIATYNNGGSTGTAKVRAEEEFWASIVDAPGTSTSKNEASGVSGARFIGTPQLTAVNDKATFVSPSGWTSHSGNAFGFIEALSGSQWQIYATGACHVNGADEITGLTIADGDLLEFRIENISGTNKIRLYCNGSLLFTSATNPVSIGPAFYISPVLVLGTTATYPHPEVSSSGVLNWNYGESLITVSAPPTDTTPPTGSIASPANNTVVKGTISATASASDDVAVQDVAFSIDGTPVTGRDSTAPYTQNIDTTLLTNGNHTLTAIIRDTSLNTTTTAEITIIVDNSPPTASITAPTNGQTVFGTSVPFNITCADNRAVVGLQPVLDGINYGAEITGANITGANLTLNSVLLSDGDHTVSGVVRDEAGNTASASTINFAVNNAGVAQPPIFPAGDKELLTAIKSYGRGLRFANFDIELGFVTKTAGTTSISFRTNYLYQVSRALIIVNGTATEAQFSINSSQQLTITGLNNFTSGFLLLFGLQW